jgi:hypothetical protein
MGHQVIRAEIVQCVHCGAANLKGHFICAQCGNLVDVVPPEKQTRVLAGTRLFGFSNDHFDANSTLVLRAIQQKRAFQLSADQLVAEPVIGRNTVGHNVRAELDLSKCDAEALGVSRQHSRLTHDADNHLVKIKDLNSQNGTYLNGQKLRPGEIRVIRHGDKLRLGKLEMGITILHASTTIDMF